LKKKLLLIITSLSLLIFAVACSNESGASDDANHELTISHFLPGNHIIHTEILEPFAEELKEKSDGRITSDIFAAGALGEPGAQYDMAVTGTADISLSVHGFTPGRFPLVSVIELPYLTDRAEKGAEILWTLYKEFPDFQKEHGETTPLWLFSAEPAQIISKEEIKSVDDLKGKRVRSPSPFANQIIEALGATPVSMPMGEVYEALQRGVVDAAMAPFSAINDYSLQDVGDYVVVGNFSMTPFFAVMNTDTYNQFSDEDKELITSLGGVEMSKKAGAAFDYSGDRGIKAAKEKGLKLWELEGDEMKPWQDAISPVVEKWITDMDAKGFPGQEIYDRAVELATELE
jgi:TRAP-type C4-dicarboxylate transport system substrate-binding protein